MTHIAQTWLTNDYWHIPTGSIPRHWVGLRGRCCRSLPIIAKWQLRL